ARDAEFAAGRSRLLHFTAMHTQPWQPFPRDYSYHPHPPGELWLSLERAADEEGYEVPGAAGSPPRPAAVVPLRPSGHTSAGAAAPRVWVLGGKRAGDRAQVIGLAEALGWPYEVKQLAWNPLHHLPNFLLGSSLASL